MDESIKQFADEVMETIHEELKQIMGDRIEGFTECEQRMITCLNRVMHEVNKMKFRDPGQ